MTQKVSCAELKYFQWTLELYLHIQSPFLQNKAVQVMSGHKIEPGRQRKYHDCWYPGSMHRQDISTYNIDYVD